MLLVGFSLSREGLRLEQLFEAGTIFVQKRDMICWW